MRSRGWFGLGAVLLMAVACTAVAEEMRYIRIGAGPPGDSHFQLGSVIVSAISSPPGGLPCSDDVACGTPGLIATAPTTGGSVADVTAIAEGRLDAALVQSDIAWWAMQGKAPYAAQPLAGLRTVSNLYPDYIHLVVRRDSPIRTLKDLAGKKVSLGNEGSGTLAHARLVLDAWGLPERRIKAQFLQTSLAADVLAKGEIDAFFLVDGTPAPSVAALARRLPIRLVPLDGAQRMALARQDPLLSPANIPADTYEGISGDIATLQVPVSLIVAAKLPDNLVYGIAKALWQPETTRLLAANRARADAMIPASAVNQLGVPLHAGAQRYYRDIGLAF